MDVISKEGPLFLQGVKFGKVRLFTENDHFTLNSIGHFYVFFYLEYYLILVLVLLFDVLVLMLFKLLILIVYFIHFPAQLAEFISQVRSWDQLVREWKSVN